MEMKPPRFHVLAVDDNHFHRKLLEKMLTLSSYQVTCVESGDEALKYLRLLSSPSLSSSLNDHCQVNMIMTDYSMPGMTGYDLLRRLKGKGSSWQDIPVVVMSSENIPSRIHMCLEGGAEEFLMKPVKLSDVKNLRQYHPINSSCGMGVEKRLKVEVATEEYEVSTQRKRTKIFVTTTGKSF